MSALVLDDIDIDEAADTAKAWTWKAGAPATAVNLTTATALLCFREDWDADPSVSLTNTTGITLDAVGGIAWVLSASQTAILVQDFCKLRGVYDLIITFPSAPSQYPYQKVFKFAQGAVRLIRSASR